MSVNIPIKIDYLSSYTGSPGQVINIYGAGFSYVNKVIWSGKASDYPSGITGQFQVINTGVIRSIVPSGVVSGKVSVISTKNVLTGTFTGFTPAPTIYGFFPSSGMTGDSIIVSGRNFNGINTFYFNTVSGSFTVTDNTGIRAAVPSGNYQGYIKVVGDKNVSAYSYTKFTPIVNITGISPSYTKTGVPFYISGKNFIPEVMSTTGDEVYKVNLGGATASFYRINEILLSGTLPTNTISGKISIYTTGGISLYPSNTYLNVINSPPYFLNLFPNSIRSGENYYGTITGFNLSLVTGISLSGVESGNTGSYINFGTGNLIFDNKSNRLNISGVRISGSSVKTGAHLLYGINSINDYSYSPQNNYLLVTSSGVGISES